MTSDLQTAIVAAIREALPADMRPALDPDVVPLDILASLTEAVHSGNCTPAQAAEALVVCFELGDATEAGELSVTHGLALMERLGYRHLGKVGAD